MKRLAMGILVGMALGAAAAPAALQAGREDEVLRALCDRFEATSGGRLQALERTVARDLATNESQKRDAHLPPALFTLQQRDEGERRSLAAMRALVCITPRP